MIKKSQILEERGTHRGIKEGPYSLPNTTYLTHASIRPPMAFDPLAVFKQVEHWIDHLEVEHMTKE